MAAAAVVLNQNFGFGGKTRLPKFIDAYLDLLKDLENGKANSIGLVEQFEDLTGYELDI